MKAPEGMICGLIRCDGLIVGDCNDECSLQAGCDVEWFADYASRETSEVDAWRRQRESEKLQLKANDMKTVLEYANKRIEAERWLDLHPVEDNATLPAYPSNFEHLRPEVERLSKTPFEVSTTVMDAVRGSAAATDERVAIREQGRALAV